jgi:prefoldin subunit 5
VNVEARQMDVAVEKKVMEDVEFLKKKVKELDFTLRVALAALNEHVPGFADALRTMQKRM